MLPELGDVHLAKPSEEKVGSSSDSGQGVWRQLRKEIASKWAKSVVSLTSFNKGAYTDQLPLHIFI